MTPSFSLGWRVAMRKAATGGTAGERTERNASQKLERLAAAVKSGRMGLSESLAAALEDPAMAQMMSSLLGGAMGGANPTMSPSKAMSKAKPKGASLKTAKR